MNPPPAPLKHRLFHGIGRLRSAWMLRGFHRDAAHAQAVNQAALARVLLANRDCAHGRRYGFAALARDPSAFRRALPLERWTDVAPEVARMAAGEAGLRVSEPVIFFALSSGTTGSSKRIPSTASSFAWQRRYYTGINPAVPASKVPGGFDPHPGIALLSAAGATARTEGGIPVALASANGISRVRRIVPFLWTSPWPVFEVADPDASWYLHALFGLRARTAKFLNAVFAPHLVAWLRFTEERWEGLLRDVAEGRISGNLDLPSGQRRAVEAALSPDPIRAAELERAVAGGFQGFAPRVWPWMRYVATVITGPFSAALPRLRYYIGDLPVHTTTWSASEGMIGLNVDLDRPERYVLCNGCAHFEFIPSDHADRDQPETIDLLDLVVGRSYEVVLTNDAGLYRYRLGDIAEVVDFHGQAPVLAFRYRMGSVLDLVGEKTSEDQAMAAVSRAFGPGVEYAAWADATSEPPRYIVYVEASEGSSRLDDALQVCNPAYAGYRVGGHRLGPPLVRLLRPGSFAELERWRLARSPGLARNQLKTPHLISDLEIRSFLDARTQP